MKKLFLTLLLLLIFVGFAFADGPWVHDDVKKNGVGYIAEICDVFGWGTDGTYANRVWSVTVTEEIDAGDYAYEDTANGVGLKLLDQSGTASGTAAGVDTWFFYNTQDTTVYAYGSLNSLSVTSGGTYNFGSAVVIDVYDAQ